MAAIAILHASLPGLMPLSGQESQGGLQVRQAANDIREFRRNLAMRRIDGLVVSLDLLGSDPLMEIDRLRKYTRPKVVVVIYNFTDTATLRAVEGRPDLVILREPVTPARLRRVLAHELDEPGLVEPAASDDRSSTTAAAVGVVPGEAPPRRRFDSIELHNILERATESGFEYTQHVAELLISLEGFEDYCRRRNAGRGDSRGLHSEIEEGAGHARAILEECMARLCSATRLGLEREASAATDDAGSGAEDKVTSLSTQRRASDEGKGSAG